MIVQGTYSDISLNEVEEIIERHGKKIAFDLNLPEGRARIRSLIKLTSSIKKASEDLDIGRSALSRWLSGDNTLRSDLIFKVLDYVGLNRDVDARCEKVWRVNLTVNPDDEVIQSIRDAVSLFFPAPPKCSIIQAGEQIGRSALLIAVLRHQETNVTIEIKMPTKLLRNDEGVAWLFLAFDRVRSLTFYCTLDAENNFVNCNDLIDELDNA